MPQPDHIIKLPPLPGPEDLPDDIKKYFDICTEKLGLIPNVLQAYTVHFEKFRTFTAFYNQIMLDEKTCSLSKLEREMIAVVVSSANRCYYCLIAHGHAVRSLSGDPQLGEMMVVDYRIAELAPKQRAMLDFAWKLTLTPNAVRDPDRQTLKDIGFSDQDIFNISDVAGLFNYANRMAFALEMMPNPEYHAMDR